MVGDGPLFILVFAAGPRIIVVHVRHFYSIPPTLYWFIIVHTTNFCHLLLFPLTSYCISKIFEAQPEDVEERNNFYSILLINRFKNLILLINITPYHLEISIFHPLYLMNTKLVMLRLVLACNFINEPVFKLG